MGLFDRLLGKGDETPHTGPTFETAIEEERDRLFGLRLFIRCVEKMHADRPDLLELKRRNLLSIEKKVSTSVDAAETLLRNFREDKVSKKALSRFKFAPVTGHPELEQIMHRSEILLQTFNRIFPGRSRSEPLSDAEIDQLLRAAVKQM